MSILLKPIITEKMTDQSDKLNRFGFIVDKDANKLQIREAVEQMYDVTVESVDTMRFGGKSRSRYTKTGILQGKTPSFKKAIVTLTEGQTIDFYSNV